MQAASSPYLPPPPQPYYQNLYHIQPLGPQDYELKRQYLALLPPQQIIEICLTFDVHVPPYIKSTIWPPDINAAIANLRKPTANGSASISAASQKDSDKTSEPIMASLDKPSEGPSNPEASASSTENQATEPQPSDKQPENTPTTAATTATTTTQTSTPPTPAPAPAAPAPAPVQQQPPYPHQPYGYPQHPPTAYPHAPYYPPPPGYPAYPPSSYPHYPQPVPNGYPHPHPPPPPHHPGYPLPPNPVYPSPHMPQPSAHQDQGSDDLPSYEEMIVEALQESTDPEGCAPKDLFAWMAARYPLQSNFRPSASQALQKAFKRGRFEKSSNGKYRLSATWEGGSTSRRTTRRPQMQSQSQPNAMGPPSASPFTHAPLVHHHHHPNSQQNAHVQPYPGQPYAYPYGGPTPGYPGYPQQPQPLVQPQQPQPTHATLSEASKAPGSAADKNVHSTSDSDGDAYEAAQNILKAINFGGLFDIAQQEEGGGGKKPDDVTVDQLTSLLVQAQNAMSGTNAAQQMTSPPVAPLPTLSAAAGVAVAMGNVAGPSTTNVRAELQAQLALLAVQLAELGHENGENGGGGNLTVVQPQADPPQTSPSVTVSQPDDVHQQQPAMGPPQMLEPPPMDALLPPPGISVSQPPPPETQLPSNQHQDQRLRQEDDIPIDPVLRNTGMVEDTFSVATTDATQPVHSLPVDSPLSTAPNTTSPAPPLLPPPPIFAVAQPELGPQIPTPNFVEGEDDSDDDDMEEII